MLLRLEVQDQLRPNTIEVILKADNETKETVTLNSTNNWEHTFSNLPKYKNGIEIKYAVEEKNVPEGYIVEVTGTEEAGYTITNSHEIEKTTSVEVNKKWEDSNNQEELRPDSIEVTLLANGLRKRNSFDFFNFHWYTFKFHS